MRLRVYDMEKSLEKSNVLLVFMDGENHYSTKSGIITSLDNGLVGIQETKNSKLSLIPVNRVVRIEVF